MNGSRIVSPASVKSSIAALAKLGEKGRVAVDVVGQPGDDVAVVDGIQERLNVHVIPSRITITRTESHRKKYGTRRAPRRWLLLLGLLFEPLHPLHRCSPREGLNLGEAVHHRQP